MNLNFIIITDENSDSFSGVLPRDYVGGGDRIAIGCYDDDGNVLGAVSFVLMNNQLDVDWLYVDRAARRRRVATNLMDRVIAFSAETMEFFPLSARYCMYEDIMPIHEFFVSYEKMDVNYSHDRFLVKPEDISLSPFLHKRINNKLIPKLFFGEPMPVQKKILTLMAKNGKFQVEDYEEEIAHTQGVGAWKTLEDKDSDVGSLISEAVYLPKTFTVKPKTKAESKAGR